MTPKKGNRTTPSRESAELHHELFSLLAHDLGSISTALNLRAEALAPTLASKDTQALKELSAQIRQVRRTVRLADGPRGDSTLDSQPTIPADQWILWVSRVTSALIPRRTITTSVVRVRTLQMADATALMYQWLAACREIAPKVPADATIVLIVEAPEDSSASLMFTGCLNSHSVPFEPLSTAVSRWQRYAKRTAAANSVDVEWWKGDDTEIQWRGTVAS